MNFNSFCLKKSITFGYNSRIKLYDLNRAGGLKDLSTRSETLKRKKNMEIFGTAEFMAEAKSETLSRKGMASEKVRKSLAQQSFGKGVG